MNNKLLTNHIVESFTINKHTTEDKHLERFENYLYRLKYRKVKNPLFLRMRKDLTELNFC